VGKQFISGTFTAPKNGVQAAISNLVAEHRDEYGSGSYNGSATTFDRWIDRGTASSADAFWEDREEHGEGWYGYYARIGDKPSARHYTILRKTKIQRSDQKYGGVINLVRSQCKQDSRAALYKRNDPNPTISRGFKDPEQLRKSVERSLTLDSASVAVLCIYRGGDYLYQVGTSTKKPTEPDISVIREDDLYTYAWGGWASI
jgi:hypothetical protein